jgi:hypothetical protein
VEAAAAAAATCQTQQQTLADIMTSCHAWHAGNQAQPALLSPQPLSQVVTIRGSSASYTAMKAAIPNDRAHWCSVSSLTL